MNERLLNICKKLEAESKSYCVDGTEFDLQKDSHKFFAEFFYEEILNECVSVIMNSTDRHRKEYFAGLLRKELG